MIYIAHRGNIAGRIPERENRPDYIIEALKKGYHVEVDVWYKDNVVKLGHDDPQYDISRRFLMQHNLWLHAKNFGAFELLKDSGLKYFWHTDEDFVLTTEKDIWTYPGKPLMDGAVAVLPETVATYSVSDLKRCSAICSDNIQEYKETIG